MVPPNIQAGDCFRFSPQLRADNHLWITLTDTAAFPDNVVVMNVTTYKEPFADNACILQPSDHPHIRHMSCIKYEEAWETSLEKLEQAFQNGHIHKIGRVSETVLARIFEGANKSRRLKLGIIKTLTIQGIIQE